MAVQWIDRANFDQIAAALIEPTEVVLDVGCGLRPQVFFEPRLRLCCEPYEEYVRVLRQWYGDRGHVLVVQATGNQFLPLLPDKSVDSVFMLDLIEHLPKEAGLELKRHAERVARRQVIIFTPLGFMPQEYEHDNDKDGWGFSGAKWQRHLSGWDTADFDESWELLICKDFHHVNGNGAPVDPPYGAFWAIRTCPSNTPRHNTALQPRLGLVLPACWVAPTVLDPMKEENADGAVVLSAGPCLSATQELHRHLGLRVATGGTGEIGTGPMWWPCFHQLPAETLKPQALDDWLPARLTARRRRQNRIRQRAQNIAALLCQEKCQMVVGFEGDEVDLPAAALAARQTGLPFVAYVHFEEPITTAPVGTPPRHLQRAYLKTIRKAQKVITATPELAQQLRQRYGIAATPLPDAANGLSQLRRASLDAS